MARSLVTTRRRPDRIDPVGENASLVTLLVVTDLVFVAGRPSSTQGIGPMSQSKTREKVPTFGADTVDLHAARLM